MIHRWRQLGMAGLLFAISSSIVGATDLNVAVTSGGGAVINVSPGASVNYAVTGELSDALNEGLALVLFDLTFSGGPLPQADSPTSSPMTNFDRPAGATNPAGYGGTMVGGALVQVCGAQNTIKNDIANAAFPVGMVMTGVASPGSPQVLVTGSFTAPMTPAAYTLNVSNVAASVIRDGEDGMGAFWAVDLAGVGSIGNLTINVASAPTDPTVDPAGSRYLAINLGNRTNAFALLVTADCPGGVSKYVGTPTGVNHVARLVSNPNDAAYLTPSQWNAAGNTLYVTGPDITPSTPYKLETDIGTPGSPSLLPPETTTTWNWGDSNGDNNTDVGDILCGLDGFSGVFTACTLYAVDLSPTNPDENADVGDILAFLDAFAGVPYGGPSPCP